MALKQTIGSARRSGRTVAGTLAALLMSASAAQATAAEVTLRAKGGGLEVTGELKSFDGTKYVIETPQVGLQTFDAARVDCVGEACTRRVAPAPLPLEPLSAAAPETVAIKGIAADGLMPALIRGYAAALGASVTPIVGSNAAESRLRLVDSKGAELATFVLQHDAAGGGLAALVQGSAEIALSDRQMSADELQALVAAYPEAKTQAETLLAVDGLAVIVSPDNPALALSDEQLAKIFSGKVASWVDVGVAGSRVHIYATAGDTAASAALTNAVLKPRGLTLAPIATELADDAAVADAVARDPTGIAVVSFAALRNAKRVNLDTTCGIITRPTPFAVKAGEYPLSRRLYLYSNGNPKSTAARGLLRYALSKDAQAIIADAGYIDRAPEALPVDEQKGRMGAALNAPPQAFDMEEMRRLLADVNGSRRLSITFRFQPGSIDLDAASRRDLNALAELLQTPDYAGKAVQLIGFTDAEGKFSMAQASSAKRAGQLKAALLAAGGKLLNPASITSKGYGPLAPIACNDSGEHRQINRRIEVWVKD